MSIVNTARNHPIATAAIAASAVGASVLIFTQRRAIKSAVVTATSPVTGRLCAPVPGSIPGVSAVVTCPTSEPPVQRSLDSLVPELRTKIQALLAEMHRRGMPLGITETGRSLRRQSWLYGCGRICKCPGRSGVVTKTLCSKHLVGFGRKSRAVDLWGLRSDGGFLAFTGAGATESKRRLSVARSLAPGLGLKILSFDLPHFEV